MLPPPRLAVTELFVAVALHIPHQVLLQMGPQSPGALQGWKVDLPTRTGRETQMYWGGGLETLGTHGGDPAQGEGEHDRREGQMTKEEGVRWPEIGWGV